jgi:hypothetical protein
MAGNPLNTPNSSLLNIHTLTGPMAVAPHPDDAGPSRRAVRDRRVEQWVCTILTRLLVWLIGVCVAGSQPENNLDEEG